MRFFKTIFNGEDTLEGWRVGFDIGNRRFGLEASTVTGKVTKTKYLGRWLIYLGWGTVRLHKFYRGDNDRASHTHPWVFWTFPLSSYTEKRYDKGRYLGLFVVEAFRPHFRPTTFEHVVQGRFDAYAGINQPDPRPFYTIVIGGLKSNEWGFYPSPGVFIHHKDFLNEQ